MLCVPCCAARERILSNLQKHPVPRSAPELQKQKAPVAEVPTACLTDSKAAAELVQQDLSILQQQARYLKIQWLRHLHIISGTLCTYACTEMHVFVCTHKSMRIQCHTLITKHLFVLVSGLQWHAKPSRWRWSRSCWRAFLCCIRTNQSRSPWPWSVKGREDSRVRDRRTSLSLYDKEKKTA